MSLIEEPTAEDLRVIRAHEEMRAAEQIRAHRVRHELAEQLGIGCGRLIVVENDEGVVMIGIPLSLVELFVMQAEWRAAQAEAEGEED